MEFRILISLSGLALLLSGLIWAITSLLHPNIHHPNALEDRFWLPALAGQGIACWLGVLGLVGFYIRTAQEAGVLGLIGFILALLGSAASVAANVVLAYVLPSVAKQQTSPQSPIALLARTGPVPWAAPLVAAYLVFFGLGYVLIGIAAMRLSGLPVWPGLSLIIGTVGSSIGLLSSTLFPQRRTGGVIFSIGLIWLGLVLLQG